MKQPFPSMPIKFWGDKNGDKYFQAYFKNLKIFGTMVTLFKEHLTMVL